MVDSVRLELTMPEAPGLQPGGVTNFPMNPYLAFLDIEDKKSRVLRSR